MYHKIATCGKIVEARQCVGMSSRVADILRHWAANSVWRKGRREQLRNSKASISMVGSFFLKINCASLLKTLGEKIEPVMNFRFNLFQSEGFMLAGYVED